MFSLHIVSDQPIGEASFFINGKIRSLWESRYWENLTLCVYLAQMPRFQELLGIIYCIYISKLLFFQLQRETYIKMQNKLG